MTRARELANFADNTAGLESLTVADITDLTATATELNKLDGFTGDHNDLIYAKDLRATGVTTTEFDKLDGLTASASDINSTVNQITDSSTDLNVDSNTLVVDKSENRVGIGNTAPFNTLHVTHSDTGDLVGSGGAFTTGLRLENAVGGSGADRGTGIYFKNTGNDSVGVIGLENNSSNEGDFIFQTYNGGAAFVDAMRITSDGKVGIGTADPGMPLHIYSADNNLMHLQSTDQDALFKLSDSGGHFTINTANNNTSLGSNGRGEMLRFSGTSAIVLNEDGLDQDFRVEGDGETHLIYAEGSSDRIGIATNNPGYRLDVNGACRIQGEFHQMNAASTFHERKSGQGGTVSTGGTTMFTVSKNDWNNKQAAIWQMLGAENNRNQMHRFGSLHANYHDGWSITTWASHDQGNAYGNSTVSVDGSGNVKMHAPIINNNGFMKLISGVGW